MGITKTVLRGLFLHTTSEATDWYVLIEVGKSPASISSWYKTWGN